MVNRAGLQNRLWGWLESNLFPGHEVKTSQEIDWDRAKDTPLLSIAR